MGDTSIANLNFDGTAVDAIMVDRRSRGTVRMFINNIARFYLCDFSFKNSFIFYVGYTYDSFCYTELLFARTDIVGKSRIDMVLKYPYCLVNFVLLCLIDNTYLSTRVVCLST